MPAPAKSRKIVSSSALRLPPVDSISPDDDRLQPRLRTPARDGRPIVEYIEALAAAITRHQRHASRSFLAQAARLYQLPTVKADEVVTESAAMQRLQLHRATAYQAWRRKDLDDITMSVLDDCHRRVRGYRDFQEAAAFLNALQKRIGIDAAVTRWCTNEGDP